jgi:histidinol-phosphate aminotransferase
MIDIPSHIANLKSYNPGKSVEDYRAEFGFTKTAILWNNENNLGVSKKAQSRVNEALQRVNTYPDPLSTKLRQKLAKLNNVNMENIVVGNGSEAILDNIFKAFCNRGDEMLTSEGTFVAVYIWAQSNNVPVVKTPLTANFQIDLDEILNKITDKTKVIYLPNANNPTATMISESDLKRFFEKVPNHILVVVDEAYFEYSKGLRSDYPDTSCWEKENLLTLRTFSKAYGLAGVRLGYAIGQSRIIDALDKVRNTFEPSDLTQAAGIGALEDEEFLKSGVSLNSEWLPKFKNLMNKLGVKQADSFANFIMIDLETEERAVEVKDELLKKGVFVRHLPAFGLPSCLRISTGTTDENEYFVEVFKDIISK